VRRLLEEWLVKMPATSREDLRRRLRARDNQQGIAAFWEMYLYVSLTNAGFEVRPHPDVPGSTKHPDYLASRGDAGFYLEATAAMQPAADVASENILNELYAALDRLENPNFWVQVQVLSKGSSSPPGSQLRRDVEQFLREQDADKLLAMCGGNEVALGDLPSIEWREGDWQILVRALPKPEAARAEARIRPIGALGPIAGWVRDRAALLNVLEAKARRYGALDKPYVIAVRLEPLTVDSDDIMDALFGQRGVEVATTGHRVREVRQPDGLWFGPKGPRAGRVSALVFAYAINPYSVCWDISEPFVWENPWAERPLREQLPWRTTRVDPKSGSISTLPRQRPIHELLGLPPGWPGPKDEAFKT